MLFTLTAPTLLRPHGVLQHGQAILLEGTGAPNEAVAVTLDGREWRAVADGAGTWRVTLPPLSPGGPWEMVLTQGSQELRLPDLLVGDLWLCSGQSNMAFALAEAEGGAALAASAGDAGLRLLQVPRQVALTPATDLAPEAQWQADGAAAALAFSAVGYAFGRALRRAGRGPIGLVQAAVGATPAEAWLPRAALAAQARYAPILERWQASLALFPDAQGSMAAAFSRWDAETDLAEREGRPLPGPQPKLIGPGHPWTPGGLWDGMIAPLLSNPLAGVIWYQGAAAPERAWQYRALFRRLIVSWRAAWRREFPFLYVQEAAFGPRRADPGEHSWAELREAKAMALAEPRTAMVVALDCGDAKDIHPRRKQPLGERLALAARAVAYGEAVPYRGPVLAAAWREGAALVVRFAHVHGRLRTSDGQAPLGFALSGGVGPGGWAAGNRGFHWAKAELRGLHEVILTCPEVLEPVAMRYAWAQNPLANLVDEAGLPAAPCRTDAYPGLTVAIS